MSRKKLEIRSILLFLLLVATRAWAEPGHDGTSAAAMAADFLPDEVIVKYRDGTMRTRDTMGKLYDEAGVASVKRYSPLMRGLEHLVLQQGVKVVDAIAALKRSGAVEYAQPNYILHILPAEDDNGDPISAERWHLPHWKVPCIFPGIHWPRGCTPIGEKPGRPELQPSPADVDPPVKDPGLDKDYGLEEIGAIEAWKQFRGSKDIVVADIDTGIDYNHEDLAFNVWRNPDPTNNDVVGFDFVHNDGLPYDDNAHGTHTAGTIGAVGGNGVGISGVAQRVSIMAVKFLDGTGAGTTADAIRAVDYAVTHGARILNASWGGQADGDNQALQDAIDRARASGVLFVAAAGNDGVDNDGPYASYPASFNSDNIISVAATDDKQALAYFSNFGEHTTHLAAPGYKIYSTVPGNKYKADTGTSMACPHVSGAAALVWAARPSLSYQQVKQILLESVDPLPSLEGKTVTGGRLNVLKALQALQTVRSME